MESTSNRKKVSCNFCGQQYNLTDRKPRMLITCGHSICQECIENQIEEQEDFRCLEDDKLILVSNTKVSNFPINHELFKIIPQEENSEHACRSEDSFNSSIQSSLEQEEIHWEDDGEYPNSRNSIKTK